MYKKHNTIFWDVDTQFDFMVPEGKLYIPQAETIIDEVSKVRKFALKNEYSIVASMDIHHSNDAEISQNPDFKRTFPPHCIAGTKGCQQVGYLEEEHFIPKISCDCEIPEERLYDLVKKRPFHLVLLKNHFNVFTNPNTSKIIKLIMPENVIIFGVALDVCVYYAIQSLLKYEDIKLFLLEDATMGLNLRPKEQIFDELRREGVVVANFTSVKEQLCL